MRGSKSVKQMEGMFAGLFVNEVGNAAHGPHVRENEVGVDEDNEIKLRSD